MADDTQALRTGSKLKASSGWFAAGDSFKHALTMLSDGAFKLFAYVSLEADRATGRYEVTQTELARALGKSRGSSASTLQSSNEKASVPYVPGKTSMIETRSRSSTITGLNYRDGDQEKPQEERVRRPSAENVLVSRLHQGFIRAFRRAVGGGARKARDSNRHDRRRDRFGGGSQVHFLAQQWTI